MKLTAVLVDDERRNRELLGKLLTVHCPDINILAMSATVDETIKVVNENHPDILFLDVQMGDEFGFDILPSLTEPLPVIIITTAHEKYAIKAVKIQAVDYLLKPIVSDELKSAVAKAAERIAQKKADVSININSTNTNDRRITISTLEGLIFIKTEMIVRCVASGAYTEIFLSDGTRILTSTNLGEFENLLPESWGFLRVHHSSIINLAEVSMYIKGEGGKVVMTDKSTVPVSQRKKSAFLDAIRSFSK